MEEHKKMRILGILTLTLTLIFSATAVAVSPVTVITNFPQIGGPLKVEEVLQQKGSPPPLFLSLKTGDLKSIDDFWLYNDWTGGYLNLDNVLSAVILTSWLPDVLEENVAELSAVTISVSYDRRTRREKLRLREIRLGSGTVEEIGSFVQSLRHDLPWQRTDYVKVLNREVMDELTTWATTDETIEIDPRTVVLSSPRNRGKKFRIRLSKERQSIMIIMDNSYQVWVTSAMLDRPNLDIPEPIEVEAVGMGAPTLFPKKGASISDLPPKLKGLFNISPREKASVLWGTLKSQR